VLLHPGDRQHAHAAVHSCHPSCAFDPPWACPLTPPENGLDMPIRVGAGKFTLGGGGFWERRLPAGKRKPAGGRRSQAVTTCIRAARTYLLLLVPENGRCRHEFERRMSAA
jgi:hypothetical protein